jgi:hypothetical protein
MLACLAATAACSGSLSGSADKPSVLATIRGTLDGSQSTSLGSGPLAVAIVWATPVAGSYQVVSTSVAVQPTFPSSFSLDLTELPPESMIYHPDGAPPDLRVAAGALVVYEDANQNGQLDLVAPGAPAYVDTIVGGSFDEILYTEHPLPQYPGSDGSVLRAGYNLARQHRWDCEPGNGGLDPCTSSSFYRSMDTPVTLHMFELPWEKAEADTYMCAVVPAGGLGSGRGPACTQLAACCSSLPTMPQQQECGQIVVGASDAFCQWELSVFDGGRCLSSSLIPESPATFGGPLPSSDDPELFCNNAMSFKYWENCTTTSPGVCLGYTTTCTQQVLVALAPGTPAPADWPCVPQRSF